MDFLSANLDKLQLACIFAGSFFLSRLIIVTKIPERLVWYLIGTRHLPILWIVFYVIAASAFLSFFIPNVITVFTLLPVIKMLCRTFEESLPQHYRAIETVFPLAIIYGANIGGMGSVTGTPANGILVLYATLYEIPGSNRLSFELWLLWGIPLVIVFILAAWAVLTVFFRLWKYHNELVHVAFSKHEALHPLQRHAVTLTAISFTLYIILSSLMNISSRQETVFAVTALATLLLVIVLLFIPVRTAPDCPPKRFLTLRDCYSNLPWRGLCVVGIIILIIGLGVIFDLQTHIVGLFGHIVHEELSLSLFYPFIAAITSFFTEIFSNTVVQLAMFTVVNPLFDGSHFITLQTFLIITLSCTNAFMTPVATGVNGLAFGEMRGMSFPQMLAAGLVMKLTGIAIIALWIPIVFGWFL